MQDGEFFVTDGIRFSAAQSSLSSLPEARATLATLACPPQQRQLQKRTIHSRPGKKSVAGAGGIAGVGQCGHRRCFADNGPGCVASPTRTAIKGETRRDLLWQGRLVLFLHAHLAVIAHVRAWRCLGSVVGREARTQTHANRPSVPKNIMKTMTKLLPLKHPVAVDTTNS